MRLERSLLIVESVLGFLQLTLANSECPVNVTTPQNNFDKVLQRKKRHLVFPKSSTFLLTVAILKSIQLNEPKNWNLDLEFDMIWPLPNAERKIIRKKYKKPLKKYYYPLRRHRRDLYDTLEMSLDRLGLSGKSCILRTICEAKTFLHPPGTSLVDDLLRVILSHEENNEQPSDDYDVAYRSVVDCQTYNCPFSLLQLFLN